MTEQENQVMCALTGCFEFFQSAPQNAPQHYIDLKNECEKGLRLFDTITKQKTAKKHEIHIVRVLTECFHFFKRKIVPDAQNAMQCDKELAQICEMGLNALGAEVEQESLVLSIKYKGQVIKPSLRIS